MITLSEWTSSVPATGTVNEFLSYAQGLDPSFPVGNEVNATPGNIGWMLFGWDNSDLNGTEISSSFFYNQAINQASSIGWNTSASTVTQSSNVIPITNTYSPTVPVTNPINVITNPSGQSGATSPVNQQAANATIVASNTNTTNVTSSDLILGGVDLSTPYMGIPLWALLGIGAMGMYYIAAKGKI